jgi:hypothetical protein
MTGKEYSKTAPEHIWSTYGILQNATEHDRSNCRAALGNITELFHSITEHFQSTIEH